MKNKNLKRKLLGRGMPLFIWYAGMAGLNNGLSAIEYSSSRFVIEKHGISEPLKIKKSYALFVCGPPGETFSIRADEKKMRKTAEELNKKQDIGAIYLSYKDYENKGNFAGDLADKLRQLSKEVTPKDRFIFAYSGHGSFSEEPYLYLDSSFSNQYLKYLFDEIKSKDQILIFSCCYSGDFAEALKGKNRITISDGSQGHSTVSFLGGFISDIFTNNKEADKDNNGKISLEEGFVYAAKNQWFTNYTNVFLQLPRMQPHLFSENIDPNTIYVVDGEKEEL